MAEDYGTAGAALKTGGGAEAGNGPSEDQPKEREDTFFMPHYPGSEDLQPGDTVQLRVVGKDSDGQCEVEVVKGDEHEDGTTPEGGKRPMMEDMEESLK